MSFLNLDTNGLSSVRKYGQEKKNPKELAQMGRTAGNLFAYEQVLPGPRGLTQNDRKSLLRGFSEGAFGGLGPVKPGDIGFYTDQVKINGKPVKTIGVSAQKKGTGEIAPKVDYYQE